MTRKKGSPAAGGGAGVKRSARKSSGRTDPVQELLSRLDDVKKTRNSRWIARCPAHDDKRPSLSIGVGDNGCVLLKCFAGCCADDILAAIDLTTRDLFPNAARPGAPAKRTRQRTYATVDDLVASLLKTPELRGATVTQYRYTDRFVVLRFDLPDGGKTFLPIHDTGDGWVTGDPPGKLPLYRVDECQDADTVYVTEGEKACDAARSVGLPCVTSAHGAEAAARSDWGRLAEKNVDVLPDNDGPGARYADDVARCAHAAGAATVRIVKWPASLELPDGGDLADLVEKVSQNQDPMDLASDVRAWAEQAPLWRPPAPADTAVSLPASAPLAKVQPFDPQWLPESLREWVSDIARRSQCPIDFPAAVAIVGLAAVVGRRVTICPKQCDDWTVVPNLWGFNIERSGTLKTYPCREGLKPLVRLEREGKQKFTEQMKAFEASKLIAKIGRKSLEKRIQESIDKNDNPTAMVQSELEKEPEKPIRRRLILHDVTVEKLGVLLNENPNGLLLYRDELIGFLKGLDRPGQECARAFFLEAWNGDTRFTYDRIGRGTLDIESTTISIIGNTTPGGIRKYVEAAVDGGFLDDGLLQRFQIVTWPDIDKDWCNVDEWPASEPRKRAFDTFDYLYRLKPDHVGAECGTSDGAIPFLRFDATAQAVFNEWRGHLECVIRSGDEHPAITSHLGKYRSLVPTIALLVHLADRQSGPVGVGALNRAIAWTRYLESHARRLYGVVGRGSDDVLLDFIRCRGPVTARDVSHKLRRYRGRTEDARADLRRLADAGRLRRTYSVSATGGQPAEQFAISDTPSVTVTPTDQAENEGNGDGDTVGIKKNSDGQALAVMVSPDGKRGPMPTAADDEKNKRPPVTVPITPCDDLKNAGNGDNPLTHGDDPPDGWTAEAWRDACRAGPDGCEPSGVR